MKAKTCTFYGCDRKRAVTFYFRWTLGRDALPGYQGLSGQDFSVAPCVLHLYKAKKEMENVADDLTRVVTFMMVATQEKK